ncbi:MAG TPA: hypothetical protein VFT49_01485 [Candidatus Saccharimonadales bacterium]|nr:hypothetical protein [Candidatus Saccharimonadales bacterium]
MAYEPDEEDLKWMKTRKSGHTYAERAKWREEYAKTHPAKEIESHGWRDFFIGLAIMIIIILIAFALGGNDPTTDGNCNQANFSGLGC